MRTRAIAALTLGATLCAVASLLAAAQARPPVAPASVPPLVAAPPSGPGPVIEGLTIDPSRFVLQCQAATLAIAAREAGPERSRLAFDWTIMAGPLGATLTPEGAAATFSAPIAGRYELRVTVTGGGGATARTFEVNVLAGGTICPLALAE